MATCTSLPLWERGLKSTELEKYYKSRNVAPLVGAWIEIVILSSVIERVMSLPLWERGLKLHCSGSPRNAFGRSPCGSVD